MDKETFLKLKSEGKTNQQIAECFGVSLSTLKRFISKNNLTSRKKEIDYDSFIELYNKNKQDEEIASELGVGLTTVKVFRKKNNIPSITDKLRKEKQDAFIELYEKGLNDSEISRILKVNNVTIHNWRIKLGKDSNFEYKRKFDTDKFLELYNEGYYDNEIAKILNSSPFAIQNYRSTLNLPSNICNRAIPTPEQEQIIIGSLLGDMYLGIPKNGIHARGSFAHSLKQENYCKWIEEKLYNFCSKGFYKTQHDNRTNKDYKCYFVNLRASEYLTTLYKAFYPNKKKIVPLELLYRLEGLGVAVWFMDDGYKYENSYGIATNCFSDEDLAAIKEFFLDKFEISISIHKDKTIYILADSTKKFEDLVRPYIHPDCLYKLRVDPKNSVKQESSLCKDNPVLNPQETEENAERLEVMPNEQDEAISTSTKAGHCS